MNIWSSRVWGTVSRPLQTCVWSHLLPLLLPLEKLSQSPSPKCEHRLFPLATSSFLLRFIRFPNSPASSLPTRVPSPNWKRILVDKTLTSLIRIHGTLLALSSSLSFLSAVRSFCLSCDPFLRLLRKPSTSDSTAPRLHPPYGRFVKKISPFNLLPQTN